MIQAMTDHPTTDRPDHPTTRPVGGRVAGWSGGVFYAGVAAVALAGQTTAAVAWLHWPVAFALSAVALLELGGITLAAQADHRRRLGEQAIAARLLSGAVALFAVVFNWTGHADHLAGGFFAGMSALGYLVWLIQGGNRRRDQLRRDGRLQQPPPAYGLLQWIRHPGLTRRARALAVADPGLGLHGSLVAAARAIRDEQRHAAIRKVLHEQIRAAADPASADIAVAVYDLDQIAVRIAAEADYDGLATLIGGKLDPGRVLGERPAPRQRKPVDSTEATAPTRPAPAKATDRKPTASKTATRPAPRPTSRPGERAAVANARELRSVYPAELPTSERQVRVRMAWSKDRAAAAIAAYRAGEDLADDDKEQAS